MQKVTEKPSSSRRRGRPAAAGEADDPPEEVRDRLAELLPEEALQDALKLAGAQPSFVEELELAFGVFGVGG